MRVMNNTCGYTMETHRHLYMYTYMLVLSTGACVCMCECVFVPGITDVWMCAILVSSCVTLSLRRDTSFPTVCKSVVVWCVCV